LALTLLRRVCYWVAPMREAISHCRPGWRQVPGFEFRVSSWPGTRNSEAAARNCRCGAFLLMPSRSSSPRMAQIKPGQAQSGRVKVSQAESSRVKASPAQTN
jgi:hypothetical protein